MNKSGLTEGAMLYPLLFTILYKGIRKNLGRSLYTLNRSLLTWLSAGLFWLFLRCPQHLLSPEVGPVLEGDTEWTDWTSHALSNGSSSAKGYILWGFNSVLPHPSSVGLWDWTFSLIEWHCLTIMKSANNRLFHYPQAQEYMNARPTRETGCVIDSCLQQGWGTTSEVVSPEKLLLHVPQSIRDHKAHTLYQI